MWMSSALGFAAFCFVLFCLLLLLLSTLHLPNSSSSFRSQLKCHLPREPSLTTWSKDVPHPSGQISFFGFVSFVSFIAICSRLLSVLVSWVPGPYWKFPAL